VAFRAFRLDARIWLNYFFHLFSKEAVGMTTEEYIQFLWASHGASFQFPKAAKTEKKQIKARGSAAEEVLSCRLCNVRKHEHKWQYRRGRNNVKLTTGGTCESCYRACLVMSCSRSPDAIEKAGVKALILSLSAKIRLDMGSGDRCSCSKCEALQSK